MIVIAPSENSILSCFVSSRATKVDEEIVLYSSNWTCLPRVPMAAVPYAMKMTKALGQAHKEEHLNIMPFGGGYYRHDNYGGTHTPENSAGGYAQCQGVDSPTRYSSKLMNSIWGMYNRYSVHNFKSLQCGGTAAVATSSCEQELLQQPRYTQQQYQQQPQQQTFQPAAAPSSGFRGLMGDVGQTVAETVLENLFKH